VIPGRKQDSDVQEVFSEQARIVQGSAPSWRKT
jgi:hypothetical protein